MASGVVTEVDTLTSFGAGIGLASLAGCAGLSFLNGRTED